MLAINRFDRLCRDASHKSGRKIASVIRSMITAAAEAKPMFERVE
jgi:hypothetical protein